MKSSSIKAFAALLLFTVVFPVAVYAQDVYNLKYPEDPASQVHPGVPEGEIIKFDFNTSSIYPGTVRTCWIYVPARYKPEKPACLFVDMDGIQFNAPVVFDNLINKGEMPVTIGVFIGPGTTMKNDKDALRFNRSNEFDNINDTFSHFLLQELLPEVEKKTTTDGRAIKLSANAADRAIAGTSSGAICAFTVAWQRPDAFSRVFSSIGTYVGMRGGDQYPVIIRKTEPKPVRIYLVDNFHDAWNPLFNSWYLANVNMEAALNFAGYEVTHSWGEGGHENNRADALFPDAMRWLWKGWPAAVKSGPSANDMLKSILTDDIWQPVKTSFKISGNIESDPQGELLCSDAAGDIYKIDQTGTANLFIRSRLKDAVFAANAGFDYYISSGEHKNLAIYSKDSKKIKTLNVAGTGLVAAKTGGMYVTEQANRDDAPGKIWLIKRDGTITLAVESDWLGNGMAISPDGGLLYVSERYSNWICSYVIQSDGSLKYKQRWYWLHNTDNYVHTSIQSMAVDNNGNLYVATPMGIQVCDQNGRVRAILSLPGGAITSLCFGHAEPDILYIVCNGQLYKRKFKARGIPAWSAPVAVSSQGAG